jgi:CheY-specific phosphatase CheX
MTCEEYNGLDSDTQTAVIEEIVAQEGSVISPQNTEIAKTLADAMCQFMPTNTVNELLLGGSPP